MSMIKASDKKWILISAITIPVIVSIYFGFVRKRTIHVVADLNSKTTDGAVEASEDSPNQAWSTLGLEQPLVIAMVGLPARGKSYLVKMITRYLKWTGFECQEFNVGSYRRKIGFASASSDFFDPSNSNAQKVREDMAMVVQEAMYEWLHESKDGKRRVAIFDATNTTCNRRFALAQRARKEDVFLLFVESICDDQQVLQRNYELKVRNDDYRDFDPATAMADFMSRVKAYEKVYETINDDEDSKQISYIKLINVGQKVITRNCHGYLPSQVAFYLQNVHLHPRKIFLSVIAESIERSGGSENLAGSESGLLTAAGSQYAANLAKYVKTQLETRPAELGNDVLLITGTSKIHHESVHHFSSSNHPCYFTPLLNELRGGDLHGLSKQEMRDLYPEEYAKRVADKLNYRYPGVGGESYMDVIERVRPVIIELERQRRSIVIVCHVAVLRCIHAYFMGVPIDELPITDLLPHHIYELSPGPFGCSCEVINPKITVKKA